MMQIFYMLIALVFISCSHSPYKSFQTIQIGQEKGDVLNIAGSPLRTKRVQGKDVWIYRFFENKAFLFKEITFENQKVTYIGEPQEIDISELEAKEQLIENSLKSKNSAPAPKKLKKSSNEETFEKVYPKNEDFEPVE